MTLKPIPKLKLTLLEREFFAGDRTGKFVRGYEPAIVNLGETMGVGRVIDLARLKQAEWVDTALFTTTIPYRESVLDIPSLVNGDKNGEAWVERHRKHYNDVYGEIISLNLEIHPIPLGGDNPVLLTVYPHDFWDKERPRALGGVVRKLPLKCVFGFIEPPYKFRDGTFCSNVCCRRKITTAEGRCLESNLQDFVKFEREWPSWSENILGSFVGTLEGRDVSPLPYEYGKEAIPSGLFPLRSSLEVSYPVRINDRDHNPLFIRVDRA